MTSPRRARLGSARRGAARRVLLDTNDGTWDGGTRRKDTLETTGFDYSGPRRSHEGVLEQQVSNMYMASIYRPTWARITRRADKPPGLLVFPRGSNGATLAHIRTVRIASSTDRILPAADLYEFRAITRIFYLSVSANKEKGARSPFSTAFMIQQLLTDCSRITVIFFCYCCGYFLMIQFYSVWRKVFRNQTTLPLAVK